MGIRLALVAHPTLGVLLLLQLLSQAWMLSFWALHAITSNAGWLDVAWATDLPMLALACALLTPAGHLKLEQALIALLVILWGNRLGLHVMLRSVLFKPEEHRYRWLRDQWRSHTANDIWPLWATFRNEALTFLFIFSGQGFLNSTLLCAPALVIALDAMIDGKAAAAAPALDLSREELVARLSQLASRLVPNESTLLSLSAAAKQAPPLTLGLHAAGVALWLIGFTMEWVADEQLRCFLRRRWRSGQYQQGTPKSCRTGLWRYSRHPNYFGEWIIWLGYAMFSSPHALGLGAKLEKMVSFATLPQPLTDFLVLNPAVQRAILTSARLAPALWLWACPAAMYYLLQHITGIDLAERLSVQSRGDEYRSYQATTSRFMLWPGKCWMWWRCPTHHHHHRHNGQHHSNQKDPTAPVEGGGSQKHKTG